jgi:hypothetical protein
MTFITAKFTTTELLPKITENQLESKQTNKALDHKDSTADLYNFKLDALGEW